MNRTPSVRRQALRCLALLKRPLPRTESALLELLAARLKPAGLRDPQARALQRYCWSSLFPVILAEFRRRRRISRAIKSARRRLPG